MKYLKLLFLFLIGNLSLLCAKQVSEAEALLKAQGFYALKVPVTSGTVRAKQNSDFKLAYTYSNESSSSAMKMRSNTSSTLSIPLFYIFNSSKGFVIVSADDATKSILAYSDVAPFAVDSIPVNLQYWLDFYKSEIAYTIAIGATNTTMSSSLPAKQLRKAAFVEPLLGTIQWNQSDPYNRMCPLGTPAGCVATAMAQIMRYHRWPITGTSNKSYIHPVFGTLSANFGETNYDWANMTPTYNANSTDVQNNAVATLMYHCGVSVDMYYQAGGSAALAPKIATSLIQYFGYDPDIQKLTRSNYTYSEWKSILKSELDALRPVCYYGNTNYAGHAFVCDGYDANDLFHINWGWAGMCDGYFELSSLNPQVQGIGGSTGGYSQLQGALIGIQQPDGVDSPTGMMCLAYRPLGTSVSRIQDISTTTFTAQYGYVNPSFSSFNGSLGVGLYSNNVLIRVLQQNPMIIQGSASVVTYSMSGISLSGIAEGNYQICAIYRGQTNPNWFLIPSTKILSNYVEVVVSGSTATITSPVRKPLLSLTQPVTVNRLFRNRKAKVNYTIHNAGTEFYSAITVKLKSSALTSQTIDSGVVCIPAGATMTFNKTRLLTLLDGEYTLSILADSTNASSFSQTNLKVLDPGAHNPLDVTVYPEPDAPVFSASNTVFQKTEIPSYEPNSVSTTLNNTGGYFDGTLAVIYSSTTDAAQYVIVKQEGVVVDTNIPQTLTFEGALSVLPATYRVRLAYLNGLSWITIANFNNVAIISPTLTVINPIETVANAAGSQITVNVTSNTTWTASTNSNWLTIDTPTYTGNGPLSFTAIANTGIARTASIKLSTTGGLSRLFNITQDAGLNASFTDTNQVDFSLYPHPTQQILNVRMDASVLQLEVFDVAGRMLRKNSFSKSISTKSLMSGIYVLRAKTNKGVYSKRFLIN